MDQKIRESIKIVDQFFRENNRDYDTQQVVDALKTLVDWLNKIHKP